MSTEIEIKHLDRRTQERYVTRGALAQKDLEKHLKSLPDLEAKAEDIETQQPDLVG
jgi:hypothetical protein